jgi:hypothetical protein
VTQVGVQVNKHAHLSDVQREMIADGWKKAALAEHASIASFSRFTLQLLHLGAPAHLVRASVAATNDEINHTVMCLDMVHYWTGKKIGPAAFDLSNVKNDFDVESIIYSTITEGCVGETISAEVAVRGVSLAQDNRTRDVLQQIAFEEQNHADLAWNFLAWATEKYANMRGKINDWFHAINAETGYLDIKITEHDKFLCEYGIIKGQERRDIIFSTFEKIITPRLKSMAIL